MSENLNAGAVNCSICGELYTLPEDKVLGNVPHVLLCSHIYCTACLRSLESPQNVISCPECKMETTVGENGVDGLEVDSRIVGLICTAKMNSQKNTRGRDRRRVRRHKSPCASVQKSTELDPTLLKSLDEALCMAAKTLTQLESLHQTMLKGRQSQVTKEKARLVKEIDEATDSAVSILQERRSVMVSELSGLEQFFTFHQEETERVLERKKELETAIQKAKHVRQVPSLENYCQLDKVLEILKTPVDVQSFDLSSLSVGSGLSCRFQADILVQCLSRCLKINVGEIKMLPADAPALRPPQKALPTADCVGQRRDGRAAQPKPSPPQPAGQDPSDTPNVIIEEITNDLDIDFPPLPYPEMKLAERQRSQTRKHSAPLVEPPVRQPRTLQEWVVVTHVENPTHFYVRYMVDKKYAAQLAKRIKALCSGDKTLFSFNDEIKTGSLVFVLWKENTWCRANVCEIFQRGRTESVHQCPVTELKSLRVFLQDYGFFKGLSLSGDGVMDELNERLRRAEEDVQLEMKRWAPQAIKCSLRGIIPANLAKGWSREACEQFRSVVGSGAVEMQVFAEEGDALLVDLRKPPMGGSGGSMPVSLREYLVHMELAKFYAPVADIGDSKPLQFYPPTQPTPKVEMNAVVSHINTPSDFYIKLVDNMEFLLLSRKLQDFYGPAGGESEKPQVFCPVLGQACVALYDDSMWYRAKVTGFPGGRLVQVHFVDFGNSKTLSVNDLRQIKDEFFTLPAMAVRCCLAGVVKLGKTWSDESIGRFRSLVEQRLVICVAMRSVTRPAALPVSLYKIGCSSSYADVLVKEGLAAHRKRSSVKVRPHVEAPVWDPPIDGGAALAEESAPLPADSRRLQVSLTALTRLKDLPVRVTHVTSLGTFCVQLLQFDPQLKRIHDLLKKEHSKSEPQRVDWRTDAFCAANVNGVWERGQVCGTPSGSMAEILRCDFGNKVKLHMNNLRPLSPDLTGSLLMECSLSGIRPAGGRSTWTATARDFFSYYLTGATATMTITEPPPAHPVLVSLFCSNREGQDVSVADVLVSEGLALRDRCLLTPTPEQTPPLEKAPCVQEESLPAAPEGEVACGEAADGEVTVDTSGRIALPPEQVETQAYLPPKLPHCGLSLMTVTAVGEDGTIYAMSPQAEHEFELLQERLQQHIKTLPRLKHYNWRSVLGCVVMGSDMLWYRGQVQELVGGHVKVWYVDQGLVENIPVCHVYPMVLCEDVPQLCLRCKLSGVTPVGNVWQWDAVALMKESLIDRSVNVQVMDLPADPRECLNVEILLDGMALSTIMIHHQHATMDGGVNNQQDNVVTPPLPVLDDWDLNTVGLNDLPSVLGVLTDPKLPEKGEGFRVRILHVRAPNKVFLSLLDNAAGEQQETETLEEALRRVNEEKDTLPHLTDFPIEGPCLAEYSDGRYYRAKLLGFSELSPCVKMLVRYVDFGSDDILPLQKLRQLPASLLRYPCVAVRAQLAGFKPPRVCAEQVRIPYQPEWSMRAMLEMMDLLHGNISAVRTTTKPELTVLLYNADGTLVHVPLVEKGLADYE